MSEIISSAASKLKAASKNPVTYAALVTGALVAFALGALRKAKKSA